jgi:hypothetical protein
MPSTGAVGTDGEEDGEDLAGAGELVAHGAVAAGQVVAGVEEEAGAAAGAVDEAVDVAVGGAEGRCCRTRAGAEDVGTGEGDEAATQVWLTRKFLRQASRASSWSWSHSV